jgi:hypothetical protein
VASFEYQNIQIWAFLRALEMKMLVNFLASFCPLLFYVPPFGILCDHMVYLWSFGILFPVLVYCAKKNLATLLNKMKNFKLNKGIM